jgi:hypothetical protein
VVHTRAHLTPHARVIAGGRRDTVSVRAVLTRTLTGPTLLRQSFCPKNGVVEFIYRSKKTFPFIDLKTGQSMPKKSITQRFSGAGDGCSNTDETEPSFWISRQLRRGTTMYEQVLVRGKGYRITLLTVDEDEAEDDDDEYEREQSEWRPGFR